MRMAGAGRARVRPSACWSWVDLVRERLRCLWVFHSRKNGSSWGSCVATMVFSLWVGLSNGVYAKTVPTELGSIEIAVPRDCEGSFTPWLVPKRSPRLDGFDDMIVSLYAGGMTIRDIPASFRNHDEDGIYDTDIDPRLAVDSVDHEILYPSRIFTRLRQRLHG